MTAPVRKQALRQIRRFLTAAQQTSDARKTLGADRFSNPAGIAQLLSKELNVIIARPQIREQIDRHGFALADATPEV